MKRSYFISGYVTELHAWHSEPPTCRTWCCRDRSVSMSALASPWVVVGGGSDVAAPVGGEAEIEAAACCVIISLAAAAAAAAAVAVVNQVLPAVYYVYPSSGQSGFRILI